MKQLLNQREKYGLLISLETNEYKIVKFTSIYNLINMGLINTNKYFTLYRVFTEKPTEEEILDICQNIAPNIKKV